MSREVIGATVVLKWWHDEEPIGAYCSFGEYDEETERDSFGIEDVEIFFYFDGPEELQQVKEQDRSTNSLGFDILDYRLEYADDEGVR